MAAIAKDSVVQNVKDSVVQVRVEDAPIKQVEMEAIKHQFRQEQAMTLNQDLGHLPVTNEVNKHHAHQQNGHVKNHGPPAHHVHHHDGGNFLYPVIAIMRWSYSIKEKGTLCNLHSNLLQVVCLFAKHAECSA